MKKLLSAAVLAGALAAPAAAQSPDTAVLGGYDGLKWGADRAKVTTYWNEQPLSETRERGLARLRFKEYNGMDWVLAVHDQRGFVQFEATSASSVPVGACEAVFNYYHQAFMKLYPHITPVGGKRNAGGGDLCEAVKAGRAEARYSWTDPVNGAVATLQVNRDGRTGYTMAAPFYREWASAAPAAVPPAAAPRPAAQRLGLSAAAFRAIRPGMSLEEVNALVGFAGTQTSSTDIGGHRSAGYKWQRGAEFMIVTFMDGRALQTMQGGLDTQPASARTATLAKYNQVQVGMTLEEVTRIMGGAGNFTGFVDIVGTLSEGYSWKGASLGTLMTASFRDGRLTTRMQFGLR